MAVHLRRAGAACRAGAPFRYSQQQSAFDGLAGFGQGYAEGLVLRDPCKAFVNFDAIAPGAFGVMMADKRLFNPARPGAGDDILDATVPPVHSRNRRPRADAPGPLIF